MASWIRLTRATRSSRGVKLPFTNCDKWGGVQCGKLSMLMYIQIHDADINKNSIILFKVSTYMMTLTPTTGGASSRETSSNNNSPNYSERQACVCHLSACNNYDDFLVLSPHEPDECTKKCLKFFPLLLPRDPHEHACQDSFFQPALLSHSHLSRMQL